jgi:hypothetical protein
MSLRKIIYRTAYLFLGVGYVRILAYGSVAKVEIASSPQCIGTPRNDTNPDFLVIARPT